ncbi:bacteriocin [Anaerovibrio sp.]|uniref:bacteriocin n=1 Tax=Anaerovibrio sp. TaxID=1872532 RepID=UPI003F16FBBD
MTDNAVIEKMNEEELEQVSGGAWGSNHKYSTAIYNEAGIAVKHHGGAIKDEFVWNGTPVRNYEANALVFWGHTHDNDPVDLEEAIRYMNQNKSAFVKDYKSLRG